MKTVNRLQSLLQGVSDEKTKKWFENYLKNVICYRGVKTPLILKTLDRWRKEERIDRWTSEKQLAIACELIRQKTAEDKFAGIIYIQKHLYKQMDPKILLKNFDRLYKESCFWDWCTTDWFCVRVLDPMIIFHGKSVAEIIAGWRKSKNFWQRRSSIVAFRKASKERKYHSFIRKIVSDLVKEQSRFIQTAVGWVLSDLSKDHPEVVEKIVEKHFDFLFPEVIRRHTRHLSKHGIYRLKKRKIQ